METGRRGQVKVTFVRHAEAEHNRAEAVHGKGSALDEAYFDCALTTDGHSACHTARSSPPHTHGYQLVLVSPLSRAIQTALLLIGRSDGSVKKRKRMKKTTTEQQGEEEEKRKDDDDGDDDDDDDDDRGRNTGVRIVCHETLRETYGLHPCDRRRTRTELKKRFEVVDFDLLATDDDVLHTPHVREDNPHRFARAAEFLRWLHSYVSQTGGGGGGGGERGESIEAVLVVTHSGFLNSIRDCGLLSTKCEQTWREKGRFANLDSLTLDLPLIDLNI
jgi:broad specificity phosphatase PhoE